MLHWEDDTVTNSDDFARRVDALEAKDAIRRLMAAYVRARDLGEGAAGLGDFFTADATWEGTGRLAEVLGRYQGRTAIAERFAGPLARGLHLLTNESIEVQGDEAVGCWTYLQPAMVQGRACWLAARYHNDFRRQDGQWRFQHVRIEGIFEAPYEEGWAHTAFFSQ
jgi:SnoaL-like domain